jgi:choline dehydrogenase-like flavoprotein
MIIDATELAPRTTLQADVCIVGAGPAGLSLAREFKGSGLDVVLVESGGLKADRSLKKLNEGTVIGDPYPNPRWGRHRQVGGTANRWLIDIGDGRHGARYAPLDPIDFERREWVPHSGWPIDRATLDPYYERAHGHAGIGPYEYATDRWETPTRQPLRLTAGEMHTSIFQFGAQDVWTRHHADITEHAPNVRNVINATVLEIETDESGANVTGLRVAGPEGKPLSITAKRYVLTMGCIEATRLLLLSRGRHPNGIGNEHDVLGRFFMDHPQAYLNSFTPFDRGLFDTTGIYDLLPVGGYSIMAKLGFTEEAMRRHELLNIGYCLFPRRDHFMSDAFQSFFNVALAVVHQQRPGNLGHHAKTMLKGAPQLAQIGLWWLRGKAPYPYLSKGGWDGLSDKSSLFTMFELFSLVEQAPDPSNVIKLGDDVDPNGQRKVEIHWRFSDLDKENVIRSRDVMRKEFAASGLGTLTFTEELFTSPSSVHPIGSTRMNDDPRHGVVDRNLKVHGVSNLYVATSSVFPTSGYANPTLTVLALVCRLADHLKAGA